MPLLQPPGSRAPASAPVNPEGAIDAQQPDESAEILTFGKLERHSLLLPGTIRRLAIATVAAGILIGGLALAVAVPAHHATSRALLTTRTQRPPAIDVLIASAVSFPLKEHLAPCFRCNTCRQVTGQRPSGRTWRRADCHGILTTPPRQEIASAAIPAHLPRHPHIRTRTRTC
jgi:hypothetical protein